ncbi:MAG: ABC transporter permease [Candidatus Micrarchaeota archaeon]
MKTEDMLDIALTNIRHQKLRSWLTILGIVIGVAAIISLISISLGMQAQITAQTSSLGSNLITISPGSERAARMPGAGMMMGGRPPGGSGKEEEGDEIITFREADILRTMPGVYKLDAQVQERMDISFMSENTSLTVIGTEPDSFADIIGSELEDGRYLSINDRYSAVVGYAVAHRVFQDDEDMLNKQIEIDGLAFRVVGILEESGGMGGSDSNIYIPQKTAREIFGSDDEVGQAIVYVREGHDVDEVAADLEEELLSLHNLENGEPDFSVTTAASVQSAVSSISDTLGLFLGGIASISLIVGGIGVLNTMFMSVLEQTKTIGVFKALGAKDRHIVALFLIEAGMLGLIGGALGIVLSLLASALLSSLDIPTLITFDLVALGLVFSVAVGIIAGVAPARNAARISPVEALKYE